MAIRCQRCGNLIERKSFCRPEAHGSDSVMSVVGTCETYSKRCCPFQGGRCGDPKFIAFIGGARAGARQLEVHGQQSDPVRRIRVPAEFSSAVDAVQRGVEVQEAMAEANQQMPSDRHIKFRIGVHFGDIMVGACALVGDDVNIAAPLKSTAAAEGICISGAAYDHIGSALPLTLIDLGMQSLTNVEPIRAYAVSVAAGADMPKIAD